MMRAIILASGSGTRLAPLTASLPKPMLPVLNYPMIGHVINDLARAGIRDIGVTIGPHAHMIRSYFQNGHSLGVELTWLDDSQPAGTGAGLRNQIPFFQDQPALVVCADMLSDLNYTALIRHHRTHPATVTVAAHHVDLAAWPGDIIHADGTQGLGYQFKPDTGRALSDLGSAGTWIVHPAILHDLPAAGPLDFSADVLPTLPNPHHSLGVYDAGHLQLHDFGQYDRYVIGSREALQGRHRITPRGELIGPDIWAEPGHRIDPTAQLTGPAALGRNVTVEAHASIDSAVIGHQVTIGAEARILSSVVLPGATIPTRILVANAVIGDPARIPHCLPPWPHEPDQTPSI